MEFGCLSLLRVTTIQNFLCFESLSSQSFVGIEQVYVRESQTESSFSINHKVVLMVEHLKSSQLQHDLSELLHPYLARSSFHKSTLESAPSTRKTFQQDG